MAHRTLPLLTQWECPGENVSNITKSLSWGHILKARAGIGNIICRVQCKMKMWTPLLEKNFEPALDSVRALPSVGLGAVTQNMCSQSRSCKRLKRKLVTEVGSLLTLGMMEPLNNRCQEAALNPQKQMSMMITARSKVGTAPGSLTFREQWRCS